MFILKNWINKIRIKLIARDLIENFEIEIAFFIQDLPSSDDSKYRARIIIDNNQLFVLCKN